MAPHPEWEPTENWPEDVLCVYYESSDGIVLIRSAPTTRRESRVLASAGRGRRPTASAGGIAPDGSVARTRYLCRRRSIRGERLGASGSALGRAGADYDG